MHSAVETATAAADVDVDRDDDTEIDKILQAALMTGSLNLVAVTQLAATLATSTNKTRECHVECSTLLLRIMSVSTGYV